MTPRFVILAGPTLPLLACLSAATPAEQKFVDEALKAIEMCVHWGGEEPYDEERGKDIAAGIDRDCPQAQKKATAAYRKFPDSKQLAEPLLMLHDFRYFDLSKDQKQRLCRNAMPGFKKQFEQTKFEDPFVQIHCPEQAKQIYGK